jgi:hypothetical protein
MVPDRIFQTVSKKPYEKPQAWAKRLASNHVIDA